MIRSVRFRLMLWFACGVLSVLSVFAFVTYRHLDKELRRKQVELYYPDHPDWRLHGSSTNAEIRDIMEEIVEVDLLYAGPFLIVILLLGWWIAGKSLSPIAEINRQIEAIDSHNIGQRIALQEADREFRGLSQHLNQFLARLDAAFHELREYGARVAHELRTPLTILRLKVEQAGDDIAPELREELEEELHRLTQIVQQSLLLARVQRGRVDWSPEVVDLSRLVVDVAEDFRAVAALEQREVTFEVPARCLAETDPRYMKQVLIGLLSNALRHGEGPIRIRIVRRDQGRHASLLVVNQIRPDRSGDRARDSLGLGTRLIRALLSLQFGVRFRLHEGRRIYAARILVPTLPPDPNASRLKPESPLKEFARRWPSSADPSSESP